MKAMILAAGKGTRLLPLTHSTPKILAPVLGAPMLDRLAAFLVGSGAAGGIASGGNLTGGIVGGGILTAIAMNTHHLADQVSDHTAKLAARHPAWPAIRLYHEPDLLDTGGGVANVAAFWGDEPLMVWNGDVLAEIDVTALLEAHTGYGQRPGEHPEPARPLAISRTVATLVVQARDSGSYLQVDRQGFICGIDSPRRGDRRVLREPVGDLRSLAFNGISVLSPMLRGHMPAGGAFGLIDVLLDAVAAGAAVRAYDMGGGFWGTTGSVERLAALEADLRKRPELLRKWTAEV